MSEIEGRLVRVGIDSKYGEWHGPYEPDTNRFVYVPIPETGTPRDGMVREYGEGELESALKRMGVSLPARFINEPMHLDPDFEMLTYGDSRPRSLPLEELKAGDFIVFYGAFRSLDPGHTRLIYALIGFYTVAEVVPVSDVPRERWRENAHTRRVVSKCDTIIRADSENSGRFKKGIPIGEYRDGAYRVEEGVLSEWGGLSVKNGYIQRSVYLPRFLDPDKFLLWLNTRMGKLEKTNNL